MVLNEIEKQRVEKLLGEYCKNRVPPHARHQVRLFHTVHGNDVKIIESRPRWDNPKEWIEIPIARIKYDQKSLKWQLFWPRANGKWEKYPNFKPTSNLKKIIEEIENDPIHAFWG